MKFKNLSDNSIINIIYFIESFTDFKNMRLIDKNTNIIVKSLWNNYQDYNDSIYPKRTMVNYSNCINCKKSIKKNIQLHINYYSYPKPLYIICNNWRCIHNCMIDMFIRSYDDHKLFTNKNTKFPEKKFIPRSDGSETLANVEDEFIMYKDNKIYIRTYWKDSKGNYYEKYISNDLTNFNFKIKLSSWYKSVKNKDVDFDLNKIEIN